MLRSKRITRSNSTDNNQENANAVFKTKAGQSQVVAGQQRAALGDIRNKVTETGQENQGLVKKPTIKKSESLRVAPVSKPTVEARKPLQSKQSQPFVTKNASFKGPLTRASVASIKPSNLPKPRPVDNLVRPTLESVRCKEPEKVKEKVEVEEVQEEDDVQMLSADKSAINTAYSTAMVEDIDEDDVDDPQLVSEYVNVIYKYLRKLEREQPVNEDFLRGYEVTGKMRAILVDWLVQVQIRFHLLPETLHMTVMIIDRFLQAVRVAKNKLQLVGVTAMFIASKYEEMYAPEVGDFVYITDNTYTQQEILRMEITVLRGLKFNLGRPLPIHFLRRFSKAADADACKHTMSKYLIELALVDYTMCHVSPSLLAAASLNLSHRLFGQDNWCDKMVHYTQYKASDLTPCVSKLAKILLKAHDIKGKLSAVTKKYGTSKFMEISKNDAINLTKIQSISNGLSP